jgi:hypothetical protein
VNDDDAGHPLPLSLHVILNETPFCDPTLDFATVHIGAVSSLQTAYNS